jgi:hypothetical protein
MEAVTEDPASAQDLELPAQGEAGVADSSELGLGVQRDGSAPPAQPAVAARSLGRKKTHESCDYRPPLWSMSLGDPHGQWLKSDFAARRQIRSSKCARQASCACSPHAQIDPGRKRVASAGKGLRERAAKRGCLTTC